MPRVRRVAVVDDRQEDRTARLLEEEDYAVQIKHLIAGDVALLTPLGLVGIERKTWRDLFHSVRHRNKLDNLPRLASQVRRMKELYDVVIILIDGPVESDLYGGIYIGPPPAHTIWEQLERPANRVTSRHVMSGALYEADNALLSLQLQGVLISHSPNYELIGKRIRHIDNWLRKKKRTFYVGQDDDRGRVWTSLDGAEGRPSASPSLQPSEDGIQVDSAAGVAISRNKFERN